MRLILLGPPGAGKGTQATLLSRKLNIPHISTGDILRDQIRDNSALGHKVAGFVKSGELVPDEIITEVVIKRLGKPDAQAGFILDGFPRTLNQVQQLNTAFKQLKVCLDFVIYFATTPEVSIRRLSARRVCKNCDANFHLINMPPARQGICDFCGGDLILREDDKKETVKKRLAIYQSETASLINYYKKIGKLRQVNGDQDAEQVYAQLVKMFAQLNDKN